MRRRCNNAPARMGNSMFTIKPEVLPVDDAGKYIGQSGRQIYKLLAVGELEAKKAGRKTLVLRASCDRYLERLPIFVSKVA